MATMKITILGLENWQQANNKSIFDSLTLPDGLNKDDVANDILLQAGEFETLYSDPNFLTEAVGIWGKRYYRTFEKWLNAVNLEYAPLDNYDRQETWTDTGTSSGSTTDSTSGNDYNTTTGNVSAYDSNSMQPASQNVTSANNSQSSNSSNTGNTEATHTGRVHGNIGVTTSMTLLKEEYDVALWSIYEHITSLFIKEFCIAVYD